MQQRLGKEQPSASKIGDFWGSNFKEEYQMALPYNSRLKFNARYLRCNLTDAERLLWFHLRRKQLHNVQFYRQRPIGNYIVDFYAPSAKLVIEVDGGQHFDEDHMHRDNVRDNYLTKRNLKILRFDNLQVLKSINAVLEVISNELS